jgi:hypothetical protein
MGIEIASCVAYLVKDFGLILVMLFILFDILYLSSGCQGAGGVWGLDVEGGSSNAQWVRFYMSAVRFGTGWIHSQSIQDF